VFWYVNSTEKWTGMKATGLQIPEKGKLYVSLSAAYLRVWLIRQCLQYTERYTLLIGLTTLITLSSSFPIKMKIKELKQVKEAKLKVNKFECKVN